MLSRPPFALAAPRSVLAARSKSKWVSRSSWIRGWSTIPCSPSVERSTTSPARASRERTEGSRSRRPSSACRGSGRMQCISLGAAAWNGVMEPSAAMSPSHGLDLDEIQALHRHCGQAAGVSERIPGGAGAARNQRVGCRKCVDSTFGRDRADASGAGPMRCSFEIRFTVFGAIL